MRKLQKSDDLKFENFKFNNIIVKQNKLNLLCTIGTRTLKDATL